VNLLENIKGRNCVMWLDSYSAVLRVRWIQQYCSWNPTFEIIVTRAGTTQATLVAVMKKKMPTIIAYLIDVLHI
jgi:hypothetical protein